MIVHQQIPFVKMQGCGNDYVYVDCTKRELQDPAALAIAVSKPHWGIGSDGLILIKKSACADFIMEMYNADGSQGSMCGNGIRCVGKYVYDHGLTNKTQLTIETKSGIRELTLHIADNAVKSVTVNMGHPEMDPKKIPVVINEPKLQDYPITIHGKDYQVTCVSMGNPHAVVRVEDVQHFPITQIGPQFASSPLFPDSINTEFIRVVSPHEIEMRVWERGSGETMACGTGACASCYAALINGWIAEGPATVHLLGGDLKITYDAVSKTVYMEGPAEEVFSGEFPI